MDQPEHERIIRIPKAFAADVWFKVIILPIIHVVYQEDAQQVLALINSQNEDPKAKKEEIKIGKKSY